jgi:hypothetical protein
LKYPCWVRWIEEKKMERFTGNLKAYSIDSKRGYYFPLTFLESITYNKSQAPINTLSR